MMTIAMMAIAMTFVACKKDDKNNDNGGGGGGGNPSAEKASVRYFMPDLGEDGSLVFTFDQGWKRLREDMFMVYGDMSMHMIMLHNQNTKEIWSYNSMTEEWESLEYNDDDDSTHGSNEDYFIENGFTKKGTVTIIDKLCNVYAGTVDGHSVEYALWNGIVMEYKQDGELVMRATALKLEAPEKAFSKATIEVDWI
jgi:hypothetical protein